MDDDFPRCVIFGGGTGLSNLLKELKKYPLDITAIVTVFDDGGSSGILKNEFNIAAPGDIRRVILALSQDEKTFSRLFNYRFKDGFLNNHTVGNIILTALCNINGSMSEATNDLSKILNVKGRVLPISNDYVNLVAKLNDGSIISGESNISKALVGIKEVYTNALINEDVLSYIKKADVIIYCMGSLFTSLIPNLIFEEVTSSLRASKAYKIYIANIMTQPNETCDFDLGEHIEALANVIGYEQIDLVIANNNMDIEEKIKKAYKEKNSCLVSPKVSKNIQKIHFDNLIYVDDGIIKHNTKKLSQIIMRYLWE